MPPIEEAVDNLSPDATAADPGGGTGVVEPAPAPVEAAAEADAPKAEDKPADPPKRSLQDVVQDALKAEAPKEEAPLNPDAIKKPEEVKAEDGAPKAAEDPDADIAAFKDHPRWRQVTQERDQYKAEIETLKGPAQEMGKIQQFMSDHSVPANELAEAMIIVAKMKNPATIKEAVAKLDELANQGRAFLGEGIDPDLQQRVDDGEISEAFAKEMTKSRAVSAATRQSAEAASKRAEQVTQTVTQERQAETSQQIKTRAEAFLASKQATDPDYALKTPMLGYVIRAKREAYVANNGALTPEAGETIVSEAYAEVTKTLMAARPAPKPTPKVPSSLSPGAGAAPANPKSLQEAVAIGLTSGVAA